MWPEAAPSAKGTPENVEEQPPIIILNSEHRRCVGTHVCMCCTSLQPPSVLEFYGLGPYTAQLFIRARPTHVQRQVLEKK